MDVHVFVYDVDTKTEPATSRHPMTFTEVYLAGVTVDDFRKNPRGELGTRTATLHREGIRKLRANWIYRTWNVAGRAKSGESGNSSPRHLEKVIVFLSPNTVVAYCLRCGQRGTRTRKGIQDESFT